MSADKDNSNLIGFWNNVFAMSDEDRQSEMQNSPESWKEMAPSEKLFRAAEALGKCSRVLDYGCGNAWASLIAAKSGCPDVTAVDVVKNGIESAKFYSEFFNVADRIHAKLIGTDWLTTVPSGYFDGLFCSNVLDVVPTETAQDIIGELARVVAKDAVIVIGLNFHMSEERAAANGIELVDGRRLYVDGVLRLVSYSDDEWEKIFAPYFSVESLDHFAWPGEKTETRRLFRLLKK